MTKPLGASPDRLHRFLRRKAVPTVNLQMNFRFAGASGSSPFEDHDVFLHTGDQTFSQHTSEEGRVLFSSVPCGGVITISVFSDNAEQLVGRTCPLHCGGLTLDLGEFFVVGDGDRLFTDNDLPSPDVNLPGISNERIQFPPGRTGTTVERTIRGIGILNLILGARVGQRISLRFAAAGSGTRFDFFFRADPSTSIPAEERGLTFPTENTTNFVGRLPVTGDYIVSIYDINNQTARDVSTFVLEVSIE